MKPVLVTSGEPAGIGPDICLELADVDWPVVVIGDHDILNERARLLNKRINIIEYDPNHAGFEKSNTLQIINIKARKKAIPGTLDATMGSYVIEMLETATQLCLEGLFSGIVTAPVHKSNINQAGLAFSGHTEYFAQLCHVEHVVMMLACETIRVALVTTHLPLSQVANSITQKLVERTVKKVHESMTFDFNIEKPKLALAGLNPHAGEGGYLGREEMTTIEPAIRNLKKLSIDVTGPMPADTMFTRQNLSHYDAFIAMYHDQGLPVLKYVGFGEAVNITLGLPFVRTSVDHGTALKLAGLGVAAHQSLLHAVEYAVRMVKNKNQRLADD